MDKKINYFDDKKEDIKTENSTTINNDSSSGGW